MNGDNVLGRFAVDLLAKAQDKIIDGPCAGLVVVAPDRIEQVVAGNDLAVLFVQVMKNFEFFMRQFHGF